ncbi:hypothetical protein AAG906_028174 [Vitis piasezkii]
MPFVVDLQGTPLHDCRACYLVQNLVVLVAEYMSGPVGDPVNWDKSMGIKMFDKSMGIKMFDGDSFHSEKNKKSILHGCDIAGVTQPQCDTRISQERLECEHVMTSWTLEMDYANNISSTEGDRGPFDSETTGCIDDDRLLMVRALAVQKVRPKALGEPLVKSRSKIILASTKVYYSLRFQNNSLLYVLVSPWFHKVKKKIERWSHDHSCIGIENEKLKMKQPLMDFKIARVELSGLLGQEKFIWK